MSAGATSAVVDRSLDRLAPKMKAAVEQLLAATVLHGLDAMVYEAFRSAALQERYWHWGRPPTPDFPHPVTNARSNLFSWHGYGLAVDVISASQGWQAGEAWFQQLAEVAKPLGLKWGGDWKRRDDPHFQWGRCRASPSELARTIYRAHGLTELWRVVGAA